MELEQIQRGYLNPRFRPANLDLYLVRKAILSFLKAHLAELDGTILDIGCGHMPYRNLFLSPPSRATRYVGLDMPSGAYRTADVQWDGTRIPLKSCSVDHAIATEVFEHCPDPELVMRHAYAVLKPGGTLLFTVPFLWPLHDVPYDEYRYTPFSLERHLRRSGFDSIAISALGGWDASLAQMIGLWVRRRPMPASARKLLSYVLFPAFGFLLRFDEKLPFSHGCMITGLAGSAKKAAS